jgi:ferritin
MNHDPMCYVRQDPIMEIIFFDGCRVCHMLQKARDDERQRITQQISEILRKQQPNKDKDTLQ